MPVKSTHPKWGEREVHAEDIGAGEVEEDSPFRGFSPALQQVETFGLGDHAT
jgi:hypothetical protein